ncbi:alpha/beta fold hydrolase [Methylobacillus arboreus]|uniref:alpha/beta fold hydrolase n=1 Tax=Methylobacillus arboreus TaxID=755170 RepID=UPI001E47320E|nr:alpha/beta hydrolase [Methylobacillus arboreus]MCB5189455.1 alpha/beta fold hydrolase [Methylobacillus arboreus]
MANHQYVEKYISTSDGLTLWSESFGNQDEPAILLVMGAMNPGILWSDKFCTELSNAGFHVIRYDHRDTGKSQGVNSAENPYDLELLAADAISVLQGYGIEKAHVAGISMGGYIAQLMAIHHPDLVQSLVLISTSADQRPYIQATMGKPNGKFFLPPPDRKFLDYITESSRKPPQTAEEFEENLVQGWQATYGGPRPFPREEITRTLRIVAKQASAGITPLNHALATAASPDRLEAVKQIKAPTLVIHGKYDPCLPLAHGEYLAEHIPNAKLSVLDMGHSFQWSWSEEVVAGIVGFIGNH